MSVTQGIDGMQQEKSKSSSQKASRARGKQMSCANHPALTTYIYANMPQNLNMQNFRRCGKNLRNNASCRRRALD